MSGFPIHTGKRKRGARAAEIESMSKRRRGSKAEREFAERLFAPDRCPSCKGYMPGQRCPACGLVCEPGRDA